MTANEKHDFIRELIGNVQADILAKVEKMPEEWDGHELRRYIADCFNDSAVTVGNPKRPDYRARTRAYRNAILTRPL